MRRHERHWREGNRPIAPPGRYALGRARKAVAAVLAVCALFGPLSPAIGAVQDCRSGSTETDNGESPPDDAFSISSRSAMSEGLSGSSAPNTQADPDKTQTNVLLNLLNGGPGVVSTGPSAVSTQADPRIEAEGGLGSLDTLSPAVEEPTTRGDDSRVSRVKAVRCELTFDLETGESGDVRANARGGDSGDAFGGDAKGGDSISIGISGSVAVGGAGGPGGSAGGSGPYAGAVIGNNSSGGGGNGGNGGPAMCVSGPVGPGGRGCSGGDVINDSGGGGNAKGGQARSGDGGAAHAGDNASGDTGNGTVASGGVAVDPLVQISLER